MLSLAPATPALAGELIAGTNTYQTSQRIWMTGAGRGYYMYDSQGTIRMHTGPLPDGPVECHGAGFWSTKTVTGEGICIFGANPHQWTVRFRNDDADRYAPETEQFKPRGKWHIVLGTGKYDGMTGYGTFMAGEVEPDGRKITHWEGQVSLP